MWGPVGPLQELDFTAVIIVDALPVAHVLDAYQTLGCLPPWPKAADVFRACADPRAGPSAPAAGLQPDRSL